MTSFTKPTSILAEQDNFSEREVGLTHPDQLSFIKLADNGDIHIMAEEGLGIIISKAQNAIILIADQVKLFTRDGSGLKWNQMTFNDKALFFNEPALVPSDLTYSIYSGVYDYLEEE